MSLIHMASPYDFKIKPDRKTVKITAQKKWSDVTNIE